MLSGNSKQRSQKQAAADLLLREHGYRDRLTTILLIYLAYVKASLVLIGCCIDCSFLQISAILFRHSPMKSVVDEFHKVLRPHLTHSKEA